MSPWSAAGSPASPPRTRSIEGGARVTLFEAGNRLGGMILTTPFAGHPAIDEGADAFLARVPWAVDLARKVSLGDSLTSPATGKAAVWWNGLHDIPEGLLLGLPTNLLGLARSRLLSRRGKVRGGDRRSLRPRTDTVAGLDRKVRAIAASATRCTSDWSIRSSAASTQPTPTTSALPPCRSWPRSPSVRAACCWPRDAARRRRPDRSSTHPVRVSARSSTPSRSRSRPAAATCGATPQSASWRSTDSSGESTASRSIGVVAGVPGARRVAGCCRPLHRRSPRR